MGGRDEVHVGGRVRFERVRLTVGGRAGEVQVGGVDEIRVNGEVGRVQL